MDTGIAVGMRFYQQFKAIADSLDNIYGKAQITENRLPKMDSVLISKTGSYGFEKS